MNRVEALKIGKVIADNWWAKYRKEKSMATNKKVTQPASKESQRKHIIRRCYHM